MEKVDITVIGAGVIGLAVAQKIANPKISCLILEKNPQFGQETSSRNSEVIHSGIYYPSGTLKSKLCVTGRRFLYDYCKKHSIKHLKTGKLIVAANDEETSEIEKLYKNGVNNGVENLKILSEKEVKKLEPLIFSSSALYSPETGILDTHSLMQSFINTAKSSNAMISYDTEVIAITKLENEYLIKTNRKEFDFSSRIVINCAGLNSDKIAQMAGLDIDKLSYRIFPCKGSYYRTHQNFNINHLIYPVPSSLHNLGIHLTLDLKGAIRFGPDATYNNCENYCVDENNKETFYESIKRYIPEIQLNSLYPDNCGIRPKIHGPNDVFRDFIINEESSRGLKGFINLIGIESPGLTSCLAIAEHVGKIVENLL